jgi:hypothetical protein
LLNIHFWVSLLLQSAAVPTLAYHLTMSPAVDYFVYSTRETQTAPQSSTTEPAVWKETDEAYYNPRLDPANYLEGPLSVNAATRLRQMLARPGIVVSTYNTLHPPVTYLQFRWRPGSAMALVQGVLWKQASPACTKGWSNFFIKMRTAIDLHSQRSCNYRFTPWWTRSRYRDIE